ncbi:MAG TPA: ABC transporter permease [Thermodesulfobacteriota bacterium]|nr:ABC transporter permease [Thermodesulfobacteriota bacterium]HNU71095.1 ABC transporter permease [Thermodesulfobacteriota bacterium]HOC38789.1 ABC transporter permease [Thermodesulfobacteriota bacterium]
MSRRLVLPSRRFLRVWQRNLVVYQRIWKISFLPPLLEPLFYIAAFGLGLSTLVGTIRFQGMDMSYVQFIAPALVAISIMYNSFFETTYASFVRMYYQKTYDAMMATPLSLEDIMTGEVVWAATKSVVATLAMGAVISLFGLIRYPEGLLIVPLAFLGGFAFGCIGLYFTGITRTIETFNLPIFLFVTPMFLFSGTFFPLENLPPWAQIIALAFPLTHVVIPVRYLSSGVMMPELFWNVGYLLLFSAVFFPLALIKMHKRLVK